MLAYVGVLVEIKLSTYYLFTASVALVGVATSCISTPYVLDIIIPLLPTERLLLRLLVPQ